MMLKFIDYILLEIISSFLLTNILETVRNNKKSHEW